MDKEYNQQYYARNKEKIKKKVKEWKENNKDKSAEHKRNYLYSNPVKYILRRAQCRAHELGLEFNLTAEDILVPMICPYLKIPLTFELGKGHVPTNISLDRIDNSKGYIKGNVEVISHLANKMKSNATWEQLECFALEVINRADQRRRKGT